MSGLKGKMFKYIDDMRLRAIEVEAFAKAWMKRAKTRRVKRRYAELVDHYADVIHHLGWLIGYLFGGIVNYAQLEGLSPDFKFDKRHSLLDVGKVSVRNCAIGGAIAFLFVFGSLIVALLLSSMIN